VGLSVFFLGKSFFFGSRSGTLSLFSTAPYAWACSYAVHLLDCIRPIASPRPRLQLLRLYTTEKQLGGDKVMRFYFLASIAINGSMAAQILHYGDRDNGGESSNRSH
jgi:hypothetical protein